MRVFIFFVRIVHPRKFLIDPLWVENTRIVVLVVASHHTYSAVKSIRDSPHAIFLHAGLPRAHTHSARFYTSASIPTCPTCEIHKSHVFAHHQHRTHIPILSPHCYLNIPVLIHEYGERH